MMKSPLLILTLSLLLTLAPRARAEEAPPNVILILADDMAIGDLSIFNGGKSRTPNLDRLVESGLWFDDAHSTSPVCAPSRAGLLTGRYPQRTGVVTLHLLNYPELTRLHPDEKTIATVFRDNGYRTGLVGKWHTGVGDGEGPIHRGFQEFEGFHGAFKTAYYNYRIETTDEMGNPKEKTDKYLTDELNERAVKFIQRHADKPFFLHLAHFAPHRPLQAPEEVVKPYLDAGFDEDTATVYAMIEVMDRGIGEVIQELENQGIRERTLVIFSSDNGPDPNISERFNVGLRGTKYQVYEGGLRVPLILNWPGTLEPGTREDLIHCTDIFPTLVDVCGLDFEATEPLDGVSFAPLLTGEGEFTGKPRFWQWNRGVPDYTHNAALRDGSWKLVKPWVTNEYSPESSTESPVLYNLSNDPDESTDVSGQFPERFERMQKDLNAISREVESDRTRPEN